MKAALLKLVDEGKLEQAWTVLEELHTVHGITDAVYDELSGYLLEHHTVHHDWEQALPLAVTTRDTKVREKRIGDLTGQMGYRHN